LNGPVPTHPFLGVPPAENHLFRRVAVSRQTVRSKTELKLARGRRLVDLLVVRTCSRLFRQMIGLTPTNYRRNL
jgi:hypothetical protein